MPARLEWYQQLKTLDLPCVIVDLPAFERNVKALKEVVEKSGKTVRLATKSLRCPELIRRALSMLAPHAPGLMCYSAREALQLASCDSLSSLALDWFVAYPTVQSCDLAALQQLSQRNITIRISVDCIAHLDALRTYFTSDRPLEVIIDIDASLHPLHNVHIVVRRSPIRTAEDLKQFCSEILRRPWVRCVGMMLYDAQVAGLPDRNPFTCCLNYLAWIIRRASLRSLSAKRESFLQTYLAAFNSAPVVFNGGGTGSF
eukprot:TRINITY_DN7213_c0_g1_i2.p1 TRINITY_DN7213_c0_g1~~TRINITY_DN7213_c0_g1_i2.p1  ORF type:complete len:270 (-),score=34.10 TRINITY_DN7213_c0_g1_i2:518-1291(-)